MSQTGRLVGPSWSHVLASGGPSGMTRCTEVMCQVDEREWLAERFEEHRTHLRSVAYRMFGSLSEADDAVQEAWLKVEPLECGRDRKPRRLADDGRRARIAEHAALARHAARAAARR